MNATKWDSSFHFRKLLDGIYASHSYCDYKPTVLSSGWPWEALPGPVSYNASGFTQNLPITRTHSSYLASQSTGYQDSYVHKSFRSNGFKISRNSKKEDSGFTHACNVIEPITFRPGDNHSGSVPGEFTSHQTGCSLMSQDFYHPVTLTGLESFPALSGGADPSNGFIKGHHFPVNAQQQETLVPH